jgi:hypothetical protein
MPKLKTYVYLWILISIALFYDSWMLNHFPAFSLSAQLKNAGVLPTLDLSPEPGKELSMAFGWTGFGLMLLTNFYILRKRFNLGKSLGSISGWLNFHIFCGLVGPTLILFHCNFKVGGLVAISFWSMVISFASGIVGRYFYVQVVSQKGDLERQLVGQDNFMKRSLGPRADLAKFEETKQLAVRLSGARPEGDVTFFSVMIVVSRSLVGDLRLRFSRDPRLVALPAPIHYQLNQYAVTQRRIVYLESFRRVMGYWHSFHMPFAVFMYVVAVIHIISALLFKV